MNRPERYRQPWRPMVISTLGDHLRPGVRILDIGSGRTPALSVDSRPAGTHYVGLDIDRGELELAPVGGYDEIVVADAASPLPSLDGQFDVVISWQVLEHVQSTEQVVAAMRRFLTPGGIMLSMLSGKNTIFALPNRLLPHSLSKKLLSALLHRDPETVFPVVYDRCSFSGLIDLNRDWTSWEVRPFWRGAGYLNFFHPAERLYIALENLLVKRNASELATHYLLVGVK